MDAKRFNFTLPQTFNPLEFLPPRMVMDADFARYFMSVILTKLAHRRVDERGFVRLHAKYLRQIMGRRNQAAIVNCLLDGGAVRRSPYSVLDGKSFGYVLDDRYLTDKAMTVPITNPLLIERLSGLHEELDREQAASLQPIHHHLADQQKRLRIDRAQADEVLATIPGVRSQIRVRSSPI
jgi:hypothetical protein